MESSNIVEKAHAKMNGSSESVQMERGLIEALNKVQAVIEFELDGNDPQLTERSSQATKDISKLINQSVKRVSLGGEISREAANSFKKIVEGVSKTTMALSEISVAVQEQQTASKDVAQAIQQIAESTEESATASDTIAKVTVELTKEARDLKVEVDRFAV